MSRAHKLLPANRVIAGDADTHSTEYVGLVYSIFLRTCRFMSVSFFGHARRTSKVLCFVEEGS